MPKKTRVTVRHLTIVSFLAEHVTGLAAAMIGDSSEAVTCSWKHTVHKGPQRSHRGRAQHHGAVWYGSGNTMHGMLIKYAVLLLQDLRGLVVQQGGSKVLSPWRWMARTREHGARHAD